VQFAKDAAKRQFVFSMIGGSVILVTVVGNAMSIQNTSSAFSLNQRLQTQMLYALSVQSVILLILSNEMHRRGVVAVDAAVDQLGSTDLNDILKATTGIDPDSASISATSGLMDALGVEPASFTRQMIQAAAASATQQNPIIGGTTTNALREFIVSGDMLDLAEQDIAPSVIKDQRANLRRLATLPSLARIQREFSFACAGVVVAV
jgi:hypothetical protein